MMPLSILLFVIGTFAALVFVSFMIMKGLTQISSYFAGQAARKSPSTKTNSVGMSMFEKICWLFLILMTGALVGQPGTHRGSLLKPAASGTVQLFGREYPSPFFSPHWTALDIYLLIMMLGWVILLIRLYTLFLIKSKNQKI
jgi:hypothetical protein